MNVLKTIAALSMLSVLSFGAYAAESINSDQAQNLQRAGTISVSGLDSSPMTIHDALSEKADKQGAKAYRIVEAYNNGNYHATAELYK